jgi:hypothetical protein
MDIHLKCILCGSPLYNTDQCLSEISYHCSSPEARFWDFDRGSIEQIRAKDHWDESRQEIPNKVKNEAPGISRDPLSGG